MSCENSPNTRAKKAQKIKSPYVILKENLTNLLISYNINSLDIPDDIPKKWEKHGDLILIPSDSLSNPIWLKIGDEVWNVVATSLKCKRVGRKNVISNDKYRSSQVKLLKGADGIVIRVDDGIKISFDVTKCMFSSGNITEKLRISKFDCSNETVVDLFAGIGYFTLPFLVKAKAKTVHACEWNPNAVEALKKNLQLNKVEDRCVIHVGDNRKVCPKGIADRVNLGLIPSSKLSWPTACIALKPTTGGILHIHGLVTISSLCEEQSSYDFTFSSSVQTKSIKNEWMMFAKNTCMDILTILNDMSDHKWKVHLLHIERIKSYAPKIDHVVVDVKCIPM